MEQEAKKKNGTTTTDWKSTPIGYSVCGKGEYDTWIVIMQYSFINATQPGTKKNPDMIVCHMCLVLKMV